jgi:cytochrome P450
MTSTTSAPLLGDVPDLGDPATFEPGVPYAAFAAIHAAGGLYWQPAEVAVKNGGFWFVADREAIVEIESDPERFTATRGMAQPFTNLDPATNPSRDLIFAMDPPRHSRVRRSAVRSFGPRVVAQFNDWVTEIVREALDDAVALGRFDYVQEVAVTIPARVVARVMGVPNDEREKIVQWSIATFQGLAEGDYSRVARAAEELFEYATELQHKRAADPQDDMISELAAAVEREDLTQIEFVQYCRALMIAGFETTHTVIGQSMRMMVEDPDIKQAFDDGMADGRVDELIEEFLRYIAPAMHFARTATADMEFRGQQLREGDVMIMSYAAANRDPHFYAEPDLFIPGRENGSLHLSFGSGAHRCIGQALARLELRVLFKEFADRGLTFELDGTPVRGHSTFINQLFELPVRVVA